MAGLDETPRGSRIHIAFFGLRNAGKSTLVNAFTGQDVAIVSDVAGTTTDPVSKAMEILPLGPCMITDTAGLDDAGALGEMRVRKSLDVLARCDVAVWVASAGAEEEAMKQRFLDECKRRRVPVLEYRRDEDVADFKRRVAAIKTLDEPRALLEGLADDGDTVVCVCPIDESAPKGRLILPQVQLLRECLDRGAVAKVCQPSHLEQCLASGEKCLVVTDSQAFGEVREVVKRHPSASLTSFSILFARQKGDLEAYAAGVEAISRLEDGDTVLVAEGCTHHRQCNDIGTVKIPRALERLSGRKLNFTFSSGGAFPVGPGAEGPAPRLVVQCGGCMLTRREVMRRIGLAQDAGIPIANYGMVLAAANGIRAKGASAIVEL